MDAKEHERRIFDALDRAKRAAEWKRKGELQRQREVEERLRTGAPKRKP